MPFMMPLWPTYLWTAKRGNADELHERLTRKAIEFNAQVLSGDPKAFFDRRKENLFETHRDDDDVRLMGRMFVRACRDYVSVGYEEKRLFRVDITGWVSVQRDGDSTPWHAHVGTAHLTAIYYTAVGSGGELWLEDPRPINRDWDLHGDRHPERHYKMIKPEVGLLVVFPGFVRHSTHKFSGSVRACWVADMTINYDGIEERRIREGDL